MVKFLSRYIVIPLKIKFYALERIGKLANQFILNFKSKTLGEATTTKMYYIHSYFTSNQVKSCFKIQMRKNISILTKYMNHFNAMPNTKWI